MKRKTRSVSIFSFKNVVNDFFSGSTACSIFFQIMPPSDSLADAAAADAAAAAAAADAAADAAAAREDSFWTILDGLKPGPRFSSRYCHCENTLWTSLARSS